MALNLGNAQVVCATSDAIVQRMRRNDLPQDMQQYITILLEQHFQNRLSYDDVKPLLALNYSFTLPDGVTALEVVNALHAVRQSLRFVVEGQEFGLINNASSSVEIPSAQATFINAVQEYLRSVQDLLLPHLREVFSSAPFLDKEGRTITLDTYLRQLPTDDIPFKLTRHGVATIRDVCRMTEADLSRIPSIGPVKIQRIKAFLERHYFPPLGTRFDN